MFESIGRTIKRSLCTFLVRLDTCPMDGSVPGRLNQLYNRGLHSRVRSDLLCNRSRRFPIHSDWTRNRWVQLRAETTFSSWGGYKSHSCFFEGVVWLAPKYNIFLSLPSIVDHQKAWGSPFSSNQTQLPLGKIKRRSWSTIPLSQIRSNLLPLGSCKTLGS
jgi:hypothetical protein